MIAGEGLSILVINNLTFCTNVLVEKAPDTVTSLPEIVHVREFMAPPSTWTKHVIVVRVYYDGKVTVIVSDDVIASDAYAVLI